MAAEIEELGIAVLHHEISEASGEGIVCQARELGDPVPDGEPFCDLYESSEGARCESRCYYKPARAAVVMHAENEANRQPVGPMEGLIGLLHEEISELRQEVSDCHQRMVARAENYENVVKALTLIIVQLGGTVEDVEDVIAVAHRDN